MKIYAVDSKKVINNYFDMSELADAPLWDELLYTTSATNTLWRSLWL